MSTTATAQGWNIDPAHSGVGFSVRHMVISKVRGRFAKFGGTIRIDEKDLTKSAVDVRVDAASIDTGIADRDTHLRSPDFLDVEKFGAITFKSRRVEKVSENQYRLVGDLTIRDATHEFAFDVEYGGLGKDPWGNVRAGFTAKGHLDRRDYGLHWNQVLEAGGVLVGERVDIDIELEAVKAAQQRAA
jgi:polyisoprenoid-binding protein YceI